MFQFPSELNTNRRMKCANRIDLADGKPALCVGIGPKLGNRNLRRHVIAEPRKSRMVEVYLRGVTKAAQPSSSR
jgi:hypothetical protein